MNNNNSSRNGLSMSSRGRPNLISKMKGDVMNIQSSIREKKGRTVENLSLSIEEPERDLRKEFNKKKNEMSFWGEKMGNDFLRSTVRTIKNEFDPELFKPREEKVLTPTVVEVVPTVSEIEENSEIEESPIESISLTNKELSFFN